MTPHERPTVDAFFYGSYMNLDVLREFDVVPAAWRVAKLPGYDIVIRPRVNLIRSDQHTAYGIVVAATDEELDRLYSEQAQIKWGVTYLPQPVSVHALDGTVEAVTTYLCSHMDPGPPDPIYVERIVAPARSLGFPEWYVRRIQSFAKH